MVFQSAYSSPTGSIATDVAIASVSATLDGFRAEATIGDTDFDLASIDFDPDITSTYAATDKLLQVTVTVAALEASGFAMNLDQVGAIVVPLKTVNDTNNATKKPSCCCSNPSFDFNL
jgi:hypothetical protein